MFYKITGTGNEIIVCEKITLAEFFPSDSHVDGFLHKYGVSYLICEKMETNDLWTGKNHFEIAENSSIRLSFASIKTIEIRSNLCESNEEWKLITSASKKWSYKDTNRMVQDLIKS